MKVSGLEIRDRAGARGSRANRSRPNERTTTICATIASLLLSACASTYTNVAPTPPKEFQRLGQAKGSACGSLGILATAYNFVPMALNSRVETAYGNAVASVPEATALVDVTMKEDWYWWVLGTARCVTVTGEAIK
jgi:hypothetical protein